MIAAYVGEMATVAAKRSLLLIAADMTAPLPIEWPSNARRVGSTPGCSNKTLYATLRSCCREKPSSGLVLAP